MLTVGDYIAVAIALMGIGFVSGLLVAQQAIRQHYIDMADRKSANNNHWNTVIK